MSLFNWLKKQERIQDFRKRGPKKIFLSQWLIHDFDKGAKSVVSEGAGRGPFCGWGFLGVVPLETQAEGADPCPHHPHHQFCAQAI